MALWSRLNCRNAVSDGTGADRPRLFNQAEKIVIRVSGDDAGEIRRVDHFGTTILEDTDRLPHQVTAAGIQPTPRGLIPGELKRFVEQCPGNPDPQPSQIGIRSLDGRGADASAGASRIQKGPPIAKTFAGVAPTVVGGITRPRQGIEAVGH